LTEYLNDSLSITGYSQVIKQTETNLETGEQANIIHIIGRNRISQITLKDGTEQEYYFTFDGHGSTRILTDLAGAIVELYSFDAYGNAIGFDPSVALTEFLYNGEQFDSKIGQQYLRVRYYDPATGRFNRLDPFFGNIDDPLSLHNYLYTHADPVNGIDPSGRVAIFFPLIALLGGASIGYAIGGRWDTALLGGAVSLGFALSSPLIVFGSLLGGYFLPWNNQYNTDYRKDFWDLMDKKAFEYDHGLGFEYNYDTPTQAFLQFKGGIGESFSRAYYFGDCPMTKAMREHPFMYQLRGEIKNALMLRDISNNQTIPTFYDFRKANHSFYSVPIQNFIDDAIIIMTETFSSMIYNEQSDAWEAKVLRSVLGSFKYDFQIKSVDWQLQTAVVRFRTGNGLGWRSATRLPWTGDSSLFGDQKTGLLADVTQFFLWEEEISF
jgi:RHS repeat-associated protein